MGAGGEDAWPGRRWAAALPGASTHRVEVWAEGGREGVLTYFIIIIIKDKLTRPSSRARPCLMDTTPYEVGTIIPPISPGRRKLRPRGQTNPPKVTQPVSGWSWSLNF